MDRNLFNKYTVKEICQEIAERGFVITLDGEIIEAKKIDKTRYEPVTEKQLNYIKNLERILGLEIKLENLKKFKGETKKEASKYIAYCLDNFKEEIGIYHKNKYNSPYAGSDFEKEDDLWRL